MIDVQSTLVKPSFAIASVGITNLKYPMVARDAGSIQHVTADWHMGVALAAEQRGTHMSRFIAALAERAAAPMDLTEHYNFIDELKTALSATHAHATTTFTWFRTVKAPVSGQAAALESTVTFASDTGLSAPKTLTVSVSAKALCPCSKAISERGAHNQRSDIQVSLRYTKEAASLPISQVLELMEKSASSPVYPLLKRDDEKHITETAYDNPVFVEDIVRNVANKLVDLPGVLGFTAEAINRESIHAHDCFARIVFDR